MRPIASNKILPCATAAMAMMLSRLMTISAMVTVMTARHKCAAAWISSRAASSGTISLAAMNTNATPPTQFEVGQQHEPGDDRGKDDAQNHRDTGADDYAPAPLLRRQSAACHRDDDRIVAGQKQIDENDLQDGEPERRIAQLFDTRMNPIMPKRGIEIFDERSHGARPQPTISLPAKNCAISFSAVATASEPCTEFSPIERACALRMVPGAALAGSVAPIRSR